MHSTGNIKVLSCVVSYSMFRPINEDTLNGCNMLGGECVVLVQNLFLVQHKKRIKNSRTGKFVAAHLRHLSISNS